jgi:hypothetical protein
MRLSLHAQFDALEQVELLLLGAIWRNYALLLDDRPCELVHESASHLLDWSLMKTVLWSSKVGVQRCGSGRRRSQMKIRDYLIQAVEKIGSLD